MKLSLLALLTGISCATSALATDPVLGTFKMNVSKCRSSNGILFAGGTIQGVEEEDGSIRMFYERLKTDGSKITLRYTYGRDCVDCPVTGGVAGLTVSRRQVGTRTFETIWKVKGETITKSRNVYSTDLMTLTNTADNVDEHGLTYRTVTVWERQ